MVSALTMALARTGPPDGVVHNADKGSQGGFNWSSQHLDQEVNDEETTGVDGDVLAGLR